MKNFLHVFILSLLFVGGLQAQIQYNGCNGVINPSGPHTLNPSGTTNDGGVIRNTFVGTPGGCSAGNCTYRIIWSIANSRWEIQLSTNGGASFPNVLYFNTTASQPNPPDLSLGSWSSPVGCAPPSQLSGDVQSSTGGSAPEIDIQGNAISIVDGDVTPAAADGTNYGNVAVGNNSAQVFRISNTAGTGPLNINSINVSGAQAGDFVVSGITTPVAIPAGGVRNFTLTFTPGAAGTRNATVTVNNNDADEGTYDFAVRGNGTVSPEIDVRGNSISIADGDVTPAAADGTNYGNVAVGNNSAQVFRIDNTAGTGPLNVNSIALTGAQSGDFAISGITLPVAIPAGSFRNFTVTFSPSAAGQRNATLTINNNDADEGVYNFALRGNGTVSPEIDVLGNAVSITDGDVTPAIVDGTYYGNIPVGGNSAQVFRISNTTGTGPLNVNSINLSGPQAGDFAVSGITLPVNIPAGGFRDFTLTFTPGAVGVRNAILTINNNDANEGVYDFAVRGDGTASPEIDVQGNAISIADGDITPAAADGTNYGNVAVGNNSAQVFRIDNTAGTGPLNVNSIALTGAQAGDFAISGITLPVAIPAGSFRNFTVTFSPSAAGQRNATLTINNNDADEGVYNFALRGNGTVSPEIDVLGNAVSIADGDVTPSIADGTNFGNVVVGNNVVQTFTIDNTAGTGVLNVNSTALTGAQSGDFVVSGLALPAAIAAGASITFDVTFTPSAQGGRTATLTINNDDADEGTYDFALEGNGTPLPQVAITEWLTNTLSSEVLGEWVEIYNYGSVAVDLRDWRLLDQGTDNALITSSSFILQPGAYAILAKDKAFFETTWLRCDNNPNVLQVPMTLGNGSDEIILQDAAGNTIWQVAYRNDEAAGQATWYTENSYTTTQWGTSAAPGVRRSGNDVTTGTLGYERNNSTPDPLQYTAANNDVGSPLNGQIGLAELERGNTLRFDDVDNNALAANSSDFEIGSTTDLTIEAWVYPNSGSVSTFRHIINQSGPGLGASGYSLWLQNNILEFEHLSGPRRNRYQATTTLPNDQWSHVAVVMDRTGTTVRLYVNGVLDGDYTNGNIAFSASFPTNTFKIGSNDATTNSLEGNMDELRIWHRARTETEIRESMHLTLEGCETGLIAYYQFNDASGSTTITDATGGNDATLNASMDPNTDWIPSSVNVGNDFIRLSNSQTLTVPTGLSTQNFTNANLQMEFVAHSLAEDFTVTYQEFAPNDISSIPGTNVIERPMWTINKATNNSTQVADLTFTYPVGLLQGTKECDYRLYHRPMFSDGPWTEIAAQADAFTATTVTFNTVTVIGQFVVLADPVQAPALTRGRALNFDGNNDQVDLGNIAAVDFDFNTPFSIETWVRVDAATTTSGNFLTKFDGNTFVGYTFGYLGGSGEVNFGITNFNTFEFFEVRSNAGFDVRDGEWHHIAVTYDGSGSSAGTTIYVDGVNRTTVALAGTISGSIRTAVPALIGNYSAGTEFLDGDLDELRVWGDERTETEIRENMHLTQTGCEPNLVAYYQFNEPPGSTILPDLARGNNGTLSGFNVVTSWQASGVNTGNDLARFSTSETLPVPAGPSTQTFTSANVQLNFATQSVAEDFTVTYQLFDPNVMTGTVGAPITNPTWTINKATTNSTQTFQAIFAFPVGSVFTPDRCQLKLYHRPMNSDGPWTEIATADNITGNTLVFNNISVLGQFMVSEDPNAGGDIVRGDVLDFDGLNDFVQIPNAPDFNPAGNAFTYSCWARSASSTWNGPDVVGIVTHRGGPGDVKGLFGVSGSNQVQFFVRNARVATVVDNPDQWHHYAGVYDGSELRLYVDGILRSSLAFNSGVINYANDVEIGRDDCCGPRHMAGQIDEVHIWSTPLTETEIRERMHLTLEGCENNLTAYYQFNDGASSTTLDDATGSHVGTLVNMDASTDWVSSGVNVGNDAAGTSNSQTINVVATPGVDPVNFINANLLIEFIDNTTTEDYTVTFQAFAPNSIAGVSGTNILQNPMWTVNKATDAAAPRMNLQFSYPAGTFTSLDETKYRLYWRPMYDDGPWTSIKNYARTVTSNSILFSSIYQTGQFMVVQASDVLISDVRGEMYNFDGENNFIDVGNVNVGAGSWTLETWFKPNAIENYQNIFHTNYPNADNGFRVEISDNFPNGKLYVSISGDGTFRPFTVVPLTSPALLQANQWYHLAVVGDRANGQVRVYLNGIERVSAAHPNNATNWPNTWPNTVIGRGYTGSIERDFDGSMDEVRIWNTARTQNEIRENMHLTLKGNETGLLNYYQFNNDDAIGTANGVKDAMGVNDGTTVNMVATDRIPSEVAVAGGVSERITVNSTGATTFSIPNVDIDFIDNPNGEIVVSRLETEKPHGWESIAGDVDNEYFVVWNYGVNQSPAVGSMRFSELTQLNATTLPSEVGLYQRGSRAFGPTWGTAIAPANTLIPTFPGLAAFAGTPLTNGFSQFVIAQTGASDLPVELLNFDAERQDPSAVALWWTTAVELNNKGFEVQRMLEGETEFTTIGWVDGKGTTTTLTRYNFVDENASTDVSYYRLRQVDLDGTAEFSPIRAVEGAPNWSDSDLLVFPNPATDQVRLRLSGVGSLTEVQITLTDVRGQQVQQVVLPLNGGTNIEWTTSVQKLTTGVYFVTVSSTDGQQQWQQKLIVR